MANDRILLVEDEQSLRENISMNLEMDGYEVVAVGDGAKAVDTFQQQRFDLIILDVMLPEMDGFAVCEKIRLENEEVPVLFLTAKDASQDKVSGFKLGADDYLTKPFNLEELMLRVSALLKRQKKQEGTTEQHIYEFDNNRINFDSYKAEGNNGSFRMTNREAKLLKLLIDKKGEVVSRQQILQNVWGYDVFPSTRTIDNFILKFRKYFETDPKNPSHFHSVRGVGYQFTD
ncbi:MAG: DNA-binding response regulator [Bacteroidetes bacterium SW_11_45_7]|nr:MAG: DNA-binding response regulator [Bacteroidetes bacterium SW_11_45_7]